jgi:membrane protein insertase Oxa1/YidC/SpoIIIJ
MAVTFLIQQHLMSPPAATDEQKQQQRMMRVVMLFFPLFFYTAPSGLTLYIMASTLAGIVDGYLVRKHIKAQEEAGTFLQKKEPKKDGFMSRLMKAAEERQKMLDDGKKKGPKGKNRNSKKRR